MTDFENTSQQPIDLNERIAEVAEQSRREVEEALADYVLPGLIEII